MGSATAASEVVSTLSLHKYSFNYSPQYNLIDLYDPQCHLIDFLPP